MPKKTTDTFHSSRVREFGYNFNFSTGTLSIGAFRNERVVGATEGAVQQGLYKTQFLTLGSSDLVCQEERQIIPDDPNQLICVFADDLLALYHGDVESVEAKESGWFGAKKP
ncbi:hypothetical protein Tco_0536650 [Tanacetum coccineum]